MVVLTIVMGAGVAAIASSERAGSAGALRTNKTSIAQKAFERAQGDLGQQQKCNTDFWTKRIGNAAFDACNFEYTMKDSQGREYDAAVQVRPVDDAADGIGDDDSDFQTRDLYDATVQVSPAANSVSDLPTQARAAYVLTGRLDWSTNDGGSVTAHVCGHYRRDRSVDVNRCGSNTHTPIAGVQVRFTPIGTRDNQASTTQFAVSNASGVVTINKALPAGEYKVSATNVGRWGYYRSSPEFLKVEEGAHHEISVMMVQNPGATRVCYQITNPDDGWGYWVNATNFSWQENRSLVYRNGRMTGIDQTMRCQSAALPDPLAYSRLMYVWSYGFSTMQRLAGTIPGRPAEAGLRVQRVERDCLGSAPQDITRAASTNPSHWPTDWRGLYRQLEGNSHQICFYFQAYPIQSVQCGGPGPGCVNRPICLPTYTGTTPVPAGWDPCVTMWAETPPTGPFNPCPGGSPGPVQTGGQPIGTYRGPIISDQGTGMASYYGPGYICELTRSEERFDPNMLTASSLRNRWGVGGNRSTCALITSDRAEVVVKINDIGGASNKIDLSAQSTRALGYNPGDNPRVNVKLIQYDVPNGQGCAAWNVAGPGPSPCPRVQAWSSAQCPNPYPPNIVDNWVRPEAPAGSANPPAPTTPGNLGSSRRAL